MNRIERLQAMPIIGNAYSDREIFQLADEVLHDSTEPMQNKLAALRKIDETMGAGCPFRHRGPAR